jgi:hypothetical protein
MAVGEGCKRGARRGILEGERNVMQASKDEVVGRGEGHGDFCREPRDSVGDAFGT